MFELEAAGSALRSTLWDVAIVVLVVGMVVLAVVTCWWVMRECRRWVRDREVIRRRLTPDGLAESLHPTDCTCMRCGQPMEGDELGFPHGVCVDCRKQAERIAEAVAEAHRCPCQGCSECPTCGEIHPECSMVGCHNPTHCPPDEPGEPFTLCDSCDAEMADIDGQKHLTDGEGRCEACHGWGWILGMVDGGPTQVVSRCDVCERFGSDAEARNHVRMLARNAVEGR